MKNYKVTIFGDIYSLVSDESEARLIKASTLVDQAMLEIAHNAKTADVKKIAVLAALRIASDLIALEGAMQETKCHKDQLLERIEKELLSS